MVKDHSDNERGNLLPPLHGLVFLINSKVFYMHPPTDWIEHTMTSCGALAGMRNSSVGLMNQQTLYHRAISNDKIFINVFSI